MIFRDRKDAAMQLASALRQWEGKNPLVLAIPRGAVPMAKLIADALGGELDVVLIRKLPAPGSPEFAVGAVDETGWTFVADYAPQAGATQDYIARTTAIEIETMRRRRAQYTPVRPPLDPAGRVAIVVDDGLATGATMIAALHAVRARDPQRLICAVPVGSTEAVEKVRPHADEIVCLQTPAFFHAVGQFYQDFRQIDDDQVIALLRAAGSTKPSRR
jgi:putative phosphoribosyl transferase